MALAATFDIPKAKLETWINEIAETSARAPELTPRSIPLLRKLAGQRNLAVITRGELLVGWAAVEPLTKNLCEIGLVYVKPEYRRTGAFHQLMNLVASRKEKMLLATYDPALIRYVVRNWRAEQVGLISAIMQSRGKFISKRLNSASRKAVRSKLKKGKPLYAIVGER